MRRRSKFIVIPALLLALVAGPARAITYLSDEEALALAFPQEGVAVSRAELELTPDRVGRYEEFMNQSAPVGLREPVFVGKVAGEVVGYAMVLTERSRYRPITFLVAMDPAGAVTRVDVMIYREPRGGEVVKDRFTDQYKSTAERVRLGREIRPISGATVSGQVMTFGVNKALFFVRELIADRAAERAKASAVKPGAAKNPEGTGG